MLNFIKTYKSFYLPYFILFIAGIIYLPLAYSNGDWVLWFCKNYHSLIFQIFDSLTLLGEPQVILPIILIIFLLNVGSGTMLFFSWFTASMITIILKGIINNPRPPYYFKETFENCAGQIDFIYNHSTPSGHTTAAFAFFAGLAMLSKYKTAQFLFFVVAVCVGVSRIVLFVHFFYDVYIGAFIGSTTALIVYWLFKEKNIFGFNQWKNKSILQSKI